MVIIAEHEKLKIENGHYNSYLMKTLWQHWQNLLT